MNKAKPLPSLEYLKECFELSLESPSGLVWKIRPRHHFDSFLGCKATNGRVAGKVAGRILTLRDGKQYHQVGLLGKLYLAHRIVFSLYNNALISPNFEVDHEDGNGLNNIPSNIRKASSSNNQHNRSKYINNKSGFKGVHWHKASKSWQYRAALNGKRFSGLAPTAERAFELVSELRRNLHKEFCQNGK